jgi:hypothetical protein
VVATELMQLEIAGEIGVGRGEVAWAARLTHLNGHRPGCGRRGSEGSSSSCPQTVRGEAFSPSFSATPTVRASDCRCCAGGLCQRRLDPEGQPPGGAAWC